MAQMPVALQVRPAHRTTPTLTAKPSSRHAGTVLYGHYSMDYRMPNGDLLRIIANHHKRVPQLMLFTQNPRIIRHLPGKREASLVANTMAQIRRYWLRSESYALERDGDQIAKLETAVQCLQRLENLLETERQLAVTDFEGQELLRRRVIAAIEDARDANIRLANNPVTSEGALGTMLYEARESAQHFCFSPYHRITRADQMEFEPPAANHTLVWDSNRHIGEDTPALTDAIRVITDAYGLLPTPSLQRTPANRFERFGRFFMDLWAGAREWATWQGLPEKPAHKRKVRELEEGLELTRVSPWYKLEGPAQTTFNDPEELAQSLGGTGKPILVDSEEAAFAGLRDQPPGVWTVVSNPPRIWIRRENHIQGYGFADRDHQVFALPSGEDLHTLIALGERHLYFPERIRLRFKAFLSQLPLAFTRFYTVLRDYVIRDLHNAFENHVKAGHPEPQAPHAEPEPEHSNLNQILHNEGILTEGQTLEEFVRQTLEDHHYVLAQPDHMPMHARYTNPVHRTLAVSRHFAAFFVDTSEKNPVIGTMAMAVYLYGAGAIIAPHILAAVLTKLHLHGLVHAIKPTQALARWMSHGTMSEAISAAVTYWQGVIVGGSLDDFVTGAARVLKDDPVELAVVLSLAIGLGKSMCTAIPALQKEMGTFPWINYLALGAKGGAAIYDTVMHPGEDWLLGTFKWLLHGGLIAAELLVAPVVEAIRYPGSFLQGASKSGWLFLKTLQRTVVTGLDLLLSVATIPFREITAMALHVPFRGITGMVSMSLGMLGNLQAIGNKLVQFAERGGSWNYFRGLRPSPLYHFDNPFRNHAENFWLNCLLTPIMILCRPPFDLVKNLIVLPVVDGVSILVRLGCTLGNPLLRFATHWLGSSIIGAGLLSDNTIGYFLRKGADWITLSANFVDKLAGRSRQWLLSRIEITRSVLFYHAFVSADDPSHTTDHAHYLSEKPERVEQLPHTDTHCMLNRLLAVSNNPGVPCHHGDPGVFAPVFQNDDDDDNVDNGALVIGQLSPPNSPNAYHEIPL